MEETQEEKKEQKRKIIDENDNIFVMTEPLNAGTQGIVYRVTDPDLAIKIPLKDGEPIRSKEDIIAFNNNIEKIYLLQLPKNIPITLPKSLLKKEIVNNKKEKNIAGYVMNLLDDMVSLGNIFRIGNITKIEQYYPKSGSAKSRFYVLFKLACILSRLHNAGIIYCDLSFNNVFVSKDLYRQKKTEKEILDEIFINNISKPKICLIDSDNLILERLKNGANVMGTPPLIAPELYSGCFHNPLTDIWSFAVMAFQIIFCWHPFYGKLLNISSKNNDNDDWANENDNDKEQKLEYLSIDTKMEYGLLPFIFDSNDTSNSIENTPIPYDVITPKLKDFFQETLGVGRKNPYRRINMSFWALEFAHAYDESIICPKCNNSYFPEQYDKCPFCKEKHPLYISVKNEKLNWKYFIQPKKCLKCNEYYFEEIHDKCPNCNDNNTNTNKMNVFSIPNRLFNPFSFQHCDDVCYKIEIDLKNKKTINIYNESGNSCYLPKEISIQFNGGL